MFVRKNLFACFVALLAFYSYQKVAYAADDTKIIHVIAAENMYGDIAQQLGGQYVHVDSILNNPDQDPHLFELTPSIGKKIADADVIIVNGLGYDAWMDRLLTLYHFNRQDIVSIQSLLGRKEGENPHLWYNIEAIEKLSQQLRQVYSRLNPQEKVFFQKQFASFDVDLKQIQQRIQTIHQQYSHIKVAATEPVFGLMAQKLGFEMLEEPYQWVVMNGGEPTPKQIVQFIQDLKTHQIRILFYNEQVSTPATEQLKKIAIESGVAVVGVSETMPAHLTYQQWMNQVLDKVETTLKSQHQ
ncbi:metal ABC transporter solute-binding protein, Zn/Mn family [Commensalibacter nepenthis]|uniref:Zinc ABC transporter substrate-binding protein n=1 Tax=Commensalibacter nepenthis TaxID=3043872 RepID=A0ABT6Q708_9PROT|nr:zinc ABC transporter substrate-binding protein [Commensalibacter sp. TBRC 10068]MDI2112681.1 zinc ABC transporter substrate-binding protein [Commensalibacter sp. TBRC 10068]